MFTARFFFIAILVSFLISSARSAPVVNCPSDVVTQSYDEEDLDAYIVVLDEGTTAEEHLAYMSQCFKKNVVKASYMASSEEDGSKLMEDFSVDGFTGYVGKFGEKFVSEQLSKMRGIKILEKDAQYEIDAVLDNDHGAIVDKHPQPNDDRIDQAHLPLSKTFTYPGSAGEGVDIYIIDTGVSLTHEEFEHRIRDGGGYCKTCGKDYLILPHGTNVASIAAGKTLGVARKANIISIRVIGQEFLKKSDLIRGITAVIKKHKESKDKKSVANMSLGLDRSEAINAAVKAMTDAGIHAVVSAGNKNYDACKRSPASAPTAITVAATNNTDEMTDFSNYGKCTDIFAPGYLIVGADADDDHGHKAFVGTSQSAPHVSGTLALMISKDGDRKPEVLANELFELSTKDVVKFYPGTTSDTPNRLLRIPSP